MCKTPETIELCSFTIYPFVVKTRYHTMPLTHYILMDSSTVICLASPFVILGVSNLFFVTFILFFLLKILLANNVDPDQM